MFILHVIAYAWVSYTLWGPVGTVTYWLYWTVRYAHV